MDGGLIDLRILEQLLDLRVVLRLDLLVVDKGLFHARVFVDLKTLLVEREILLLAADVMHRHVKGLDGAFVGFGLSDVGGRGLAAVAGVFVVVQGGVDVVWLGCFGRRRLGRLDLGLEGGRVAAEGLGCC